jgi:hypothetical protein
MAAFVMAGEIFAKCVCSERNHASTSTSGKINMTGTKLLSIAVFMIVGEDNVKPRIHGEHENLHKQGYELIIEIRDVRPKFGIATAPALRNRR